MGPQGRPSFKKDAMVFRKNALKFLLALRFHPGSVLSKCDKWDHRAGQAFDKDAIGVQTKRFEVPSSARGSTRDLFCRSVTNGTTGPADLPQRCNGVQTKRFEVPSSARGSTRDLFCRSVTNGTTGPADLPQRCNGV